MKDLSGAVVFKVCASNILIIIRLVCSEVHQVLCFLNLNLDLVVPTFWLLIGIFFVDILRLLLGDTCVLTKCT